ncbi:hypothetical protein BD779DRAFT_1667327 [Infundibulicybe gibba]|nr:hypothetical protein BD779DRAFT_1667327 [Infundibulicybe gibba]
MAASETPKVVNESEVDSSNVKRKSKTEKKSGSSNGTELPKRKRRKDKTKDQAEEGLAGEVIGSTGEDASHSGEKDSKRKRKRKAVEVENLPDREAEPPREPEGGDDAPTVGKQKKRRKTENVASEADARPPKKKKHRNKTDYPDPEDDSTLNDQAKKALMYAFAQFNRPSKWKFNKARQNWLLRNMFSNESIPETHMSLLIAYVQKIQGGVRGNLIKTCQSALEPPPVETSAAKDDPPAAPANSEGKTEPAPNEVDKVKMDRAKVILESLSLSE